MRRLFTICSLFLSYMMVAQTNDIQNTVTLLKSKIEETQGKEKLTLLDSLSTVIRNKKEFSYDSIARYTIDYALQNKAIDIADKHTTFLIFYLSNRAGKPKEAVTLFETFKQRKDTTGKVSILAKLHLNGADSYYYTGQTEKAIQIYKMAERYARSANDSATIGASIEYRADAYADLGDFTKATQLLNQAENIYTVIKDTTRQILTQNSRANLYSQNGFFDEAREERDEVISKSEKIKYYPALLSALYNASVDDGYTNNYKRRIFNLKKALQYTRQSEFIDLYEPRLLNSLLQSYSKTDSLELADKILEELQSNPERNTQGVFKTMYISSLSEYYLATGNYQNALTYGEAYLESQKQSKNVLNLVGAHEFLANLHGILKNDSKALLHHKAFTEIQDSINSVQKVNSLSYYQTLYETEKRDAQIRNQQAKIALLDAKNKMKNQWFLFGGIGSIALFSMLWLFKSRRYAQKKQAMHEGFSQKLIHSQEEERTRVARELHDSVGQKLMLLSRKTKPIGDTTINILTDDTLQELRDILKGLHPASLEKLGFSIAIQSLINDIDANTPIFFTSEIEAIDSYINKETGLHIYRIIQEVLSNIIKHAETKSATISIKKREKNIEIIIKDNGKGFNFIEKYKNPKSLGMKTLLERAKIIHSKIEIDSIVKKGTTVTLHIPIQNE